MQFALIVDTEEKLHAAVAAVKALLPAVSLASPQQIEENGQVMRIDKGLTARPLSKIEKGLCEILLGQPVGAWLCYQEILKGFEARNLGSNAVINGKPSEADYKACRALGLLSGRMKEHASAADLVGTTKPIELLAERSKTAAGVNYRLTKNGRAALSKVLAA